MRIEAARGINLDAIQSSRSSRACRRSTRGRHQWTNRDAEGSPGKLVGERRQMNAAQLQLGAPYFDSGNWTDVREYTLAVPSKREKASGSQVNGGDQKARFARVVLPHLDDAYALARLLTGNSTDAEDVVQDACLRAFRGISGFANGNARTWVLTIVRHSAYNWLRKNRP